MSNQRTFAYSSLIVLGVAFVAAVMASNTLLRGMRIDLTENDLYTLSQGTRTMLGNLEEPINLYLFFSDRESADVQFLRAYATRVREMLEEFEAVAEGMLTLQVIDPLPFSEDEDRAAQYGLTDLSLGSLGESIYFGLAATNSVGDEAVIEFFDPNKEGSLEYDLAKLVYSLSTPDKSVIGLISGLPLGGGFNPQTQQPSQPWVIYQQIRQVFDVRDLGPGATAIPDDVTALWIVHPTEVADETLYAIDQFLLRGGRAAIFVDPVAEIAAAAGDPSGFGGATSSTLDPLFEAWGLRFDTSRVVGDNGNALSINAGFGQRPVRHIGLIGLDAGGINADDVVTAGLTSINLGTAGYLETEDGSRISLEPLLESSTESATIPSSQFQFLTDPSTLLDGFTPDANVYTLAARVDGTLSTAFPDGPPGQDGDAAADSADSDAGAQAEPPPGAEPDADANADANADPGAAAAREHRDSGEAGGVIVVADVDLLSDRLWVQIQRSFLGQQLATAFASNGDFVTNAIANLAGSADLIGLESRATFSRPFERVESLQREADARFRETEQQLEAELAETERRLGELQSSREDTGSILMTDEQRAEIERFQEEQLRIRQELRSVRRELDSSIERLGMTLKVVNIFVVPLALALLALAGFLVNKRRRGAKT
jgi:ABC-type uncharacterized transport system involved in gliding motility auxiliary subunit